MIIYYNPDCSKCREALGILEENKCDVEIRNYLQDPPSQEEISALIAKIGCTAKDLLRRDEPYYQENFSGKELSDAEIVRLLADHPSLIQRPILITKDKAIIGRPPSLVLDLIR